MCERCQRLRDETVPALIGLLGGSEDPVLEFIGRVLEAAPTTPLEPDGLADAQERVNQVFLDCYEGQRRDATVLVSWLITRLHAIKHRLMQEAQAHRDRHALSLEYNHSTRTFTITGTDDAGNPFQRTAVAHPDETPAAAAMRIAAEIFGDHDDEPHTL